MKVVRRDLQALVLEERGTLARLFGLPFMVVGVVMAVTGALPVLFESVALVLVGLWFTFLLPVVRLRLDRTIGIATLSRHGLLGTRWVWSAPLAEVLGARIDPTSDREAEGTWRVHLILAHGELPLTWWHTAGKRGKLRACDAINEWLQT